MNFVNTFMKRCFTKRCFKFRFSLIKQNPKTIYKLSDSLFLQSNLIINKAALMKTDKCTACNKELASKRSLRRHKQTVHKQYFKKYSFVCHECGCERSSVIELENHMRENHLSFRPRCCLYCNNFFMDDSSYIEHMNKVHGLSVWTAGGNVDWNK